MVAATKHQTPLMQYLMGVAVAITIAILNGISNTAVATLDEMRKLGGMVYSLNREVDRHDRQIAKLEENDKRRLEREADRL